MAAWRAGMCYAALLSCSERVSEKSQQQRLKMHNDCFSHVMHGSRHFAALVGCENACIRSTKWQWQGTTSKVQPQPSSKSMLHRRC